MRMAIRQSLIKTGLMALIISSSTACGLESSSYPSKLAAEKAICPAEVTSEAATSMPLALTLSGVFVGMTRAEAKAVLLCQDKELSIARDESVELESGEFVIVPETSLYFGRDTRNWTFEDFLYAEWYPESNRQQYLELKNDLETFSVVSHGMTDQARIYKMSRTTIFAPQKRPTVDSVVDGLVAKLGQPNGQPIDSNTLGWYFSPDRTIGDNFDELDREQRDEIVRCSSFNDYAIFDSEKFKKIEKCGPVVSVHFLSSPTNELLVESMTITVSDTQGRIASIRNTKAELEAFDKARKQKELDDASEFELQ